MVVGFTTTCRIKTYHHWICEFESRSWWGILDTTLSVKVCQWLATGQWFSPDTPVFSTNNTDCHDITEILLKVALNTITLTHYKEFILPVYKSFFSMIMMMGFLVSLTTYWPPTDSFILTHRSPDPVRRVIAITLRWSSSVNLIDLNLVHFIQKMCLDPRFYTPIKLPKNAFNSYNYI